MIDREKQLIFRLKQLKQVQPDSAYLAGFKRVLENKMLLDGRSLRPAFVFQMFRLVLNFGMSLIVFIGLGYASVMATQNIPAGNILYPAKLLGEKIQLGVQSFDSKTRTDLKLKFAQNRLSEIKSLEENDFSDQWKINSVLDGYSQEMASIQKEILNISSEPNHNTLAYLLKIESRLSQISEDLKSIRFDSEKPEEYLGAENTSVFMKELVSRKIFEYENKNQVFAEDNQKWQRAMNEFLKLRSRGEMMTFSLNIVLSDRLQTTALDVSGSGEPQITPTPETMERAVSDLKDISRGLTAWENAFNRVRQSGSEEELLVLGNRIVELEIRLAEIETLMR